MKKDIIINPVGLKGNDINERMKQLMDIKPINENTNHSNSVVELTKIGPDGNAYAIIRENHSYYIKSTNKKENLVKEDFKYIGGFMNRVPYNSYEKAIKHLNLKFNSLAESLDAGHNINVFENDNLLAENGNAFGGGFADLPKGGGFTGEGNLEGNKALPVKEEEEMEEEVELTEVEKAVEGMTEEKEIEDTKEEETITEHKLTILRAMENMDSIIDGITEGTVKKKVYTIR